MRARDKVECTVVSMFRRLAALPVSLAGLLFAHEFAYRLVAHNDDHRHALLDATGHGWTSLAPTLLALALLISFVHSWRITAGKGKAPSFLQILAVQSSAYAIVEIGERLLSGHNPWPGLSLLAAGVAVQLPAAFTVWALLRFIIIPAAAKLRSLLKGPELSETIESVLWIPLSQVVPTRFVHASAGRAPPSSC